MLESNTQNRKMSKLRVDKYAKAINDGEWRVTNQGIGFRKDGVLVDGQHRLCAVIKANKAVDMVVTQGLDDVYHLVDTGGHARTAADHLTRNYPEIRNATTVCATASAMCKGMRGQRPPANYVVAEMASFYADDLIMPIVEVGRRNPVSSMGSVLGAFAACCRLEGDGWPGPAGGRDITDVLRPLKRLADMEFKGRGDPMKMLYDRLLANKLSARGKLKGWEVYAYTVSALRADLLGKELTNMKITSTDWGDKRDRGKRPRNA